MTREEVHTMIQSEIQEFLGRISRADIWVSSKIACKTISCSPKTLKKYRTLFLEHSQDFRRKNRRGDMEYRLTALLTKITKPNKPEKKG